MREDEAIVVAFRPHTLLPLADRPSAPQAITPHLTRSSLQRQGISRLSEVDGKKPGKRKVKAYAIGYVRIPANHLLQKKRLGTPMLVVG